MNKSTAKEVNQSKAIKNYFILLFIALLFVGLVLYLCKWYKVYDEYQKDIPVIRGSLQEISNEDLEHFLLDNPTSIIYICTASSEECRKFEKNFKKLVDNNELEDLIVYLNATGLNQDDFVTDFNNKYTNRKKLTTNYPAFVLFDEGNVESILQAKEGQSLSITKVEHFLELNQTGE